ncbi:MAG: glycosyltransferase [Puniceicoccales bacterium]|jgi:glycosyltransferase involved in cell wall biosynthesis|nr:glycosyltransferase [Puniceicoccales bacterium]
MPNPRFTILLPVVKTRFFQKALDSALAQSFEDYEVVILDNKADADISGVAESPRVRYLKNATQLLPATNWNKGIEASRGEFILLLSDDDELEPDCLREIDAFLEKHKNELDVIRILRSEFWEGGEITSYSCPGRDVETVDEYIYYQFRYYRGQALSDFVFRRSAAQAIGGFREVAASLCSDKILFAGLASLRNKVGNLNKVLLRYRWHGANYTLVPRRDLYIDSLRSDFAFFQYSEQVLEKCSGPFRNLAIAVNKANYQIRQKTHYADALSFQGLLGLRRLYWATPPSFVSRRRCLLSAFGTYFRRKITGRY